MKAVEWCARSWEILLEQMERKAAQRCVNSGESKVRGREKPSFPLSAIIPHSRETKATKGKKKLFNMMWNYAVPIFLFNFVFSFVISSSLCALLESQCFIFSTKSDSGKQHLWVAECHRQTPGCSGAPGHTPISLMVSSVQTQIGFPLLGVSQHPLLLQPLRRNDTAPWLLSSQEPRLQSNFQEVNKS